MGDCLCNWRQQLSDGCEFCNPEIALEKVKDEIVKLKNSISKAKINCAKRAEEVVYEVDIKTAQENIYRAVLNA